MPEPKERSATWISTTFPSDTSDGEAKLCSAGYQVGLHWPVKNEDWLQHPGPHTMSGASISGVVTCKVVENWANMTTKCDWLGTQDLWTLAINHGRITCYIRALCGSQVHGYRNRVLFREGCAAIPGGVAILEIGPHAILKSLIRQCRPDLPHVATLKKVDPTGKEEIYCQPMRKSGLIHVPST